MRILVALDGSREAERALPTAVGLVKQNDGAQVVLVRAIDPTTLGGGAGKKTRLAAINEATEYLGDVAAQLREEGVRPVVRSVWYAAAPAAIAGVARDVKADVIVMAAYGRDGAGRLVPGAIAESVLNRTRIPILLVPAGDTAAATSARVRMPLETEMVNA
jgi:nucleotide-binding universal stress UspA family protein